MKKPPKIRCAIYTRKSHEEGLEQEFNSLDAQRVAAEAYVQSQMHEGWEALPTLYDDGGYSGGTLERPALQRLLADIKRGEIDVIVVYKVDRLSRSLLDFSKLVETFDAHNVSFVSVTQQFNTTNSMGRLTLNILLSFAQFEREVTGERIRDKFAASKKKGMWMGGPIPLGYDVQHRKLLANDLEAEQVRFIYQKYLELKSLHAVKDYMNTHGHQPKCWITPAGKKAGPKRYCLQSVRTILSNPIYIGKIKHKEKIYDGEHQPILDPNLWQAAQEIMQTNSVARRSPRNHDHAILFKGKVYDAVGQLFSTTYTGRGTKRYHYYLNKVTKARISIGELNGIVSNAIHGLDIMTAMLSVPGISHLELAGRYQGAVDTILTEAIERVVLHEASVNILISKQQLISILQQAPSNAGNANPSVMQTAMIDHPETIELTVDVAFRSYAGRKIAFSAKRGVVNIRHTNHDQSLVTAIVRSYKWNKMIEAGELKSAVDIALKEKVERTYAGDVLRLKYLAPEIVTMIMNGTQPRTLNVSQLLRQQLPLDWEAQKRLLNIA